MVELLYSHLQDPRDVTKEMQDILLAYGAVTLLSKCQLYCYHWLTQWRDFFERSMEVVPRQMIRGLRNACGNYEFYEIVK